MPTVMVMTGFHLGLTGLRISRMPASSGLRPLFRLTDPFPDCATSVTFPVCGSTASVGGIVPARRGEDRVETMGGLGMIGKWTLWMAALALVATPALAIEEDESAQAAAGSPVSPHRRHP